MASSHPRRVPALHVNSLSGYGHIVLTGFSSMQKEEHLTDFTIRLASGKTIPVHKMLLNVASEYFQVMFSCGMREASENEVRFDAFSENSVRRIVDYMYGRELSIEAEEVEEHLDLVETFQLHHLRTDIENSFRLLFGR